MPVNFTFSAVISIMAQEEPPRVDCIPTVAPDSELSLAPASTFMPPGWKLIRTLHSHGDGTAPVYIPGMTGLHLPS